MTSLLLSPLNQSDTTISLLTQLKGNQKQPFSDPVQAHLSQIFYPPLLATSTLIHAFVPLTWMLYVISTIFWVQPENSHISFVKLIAQAITSEYIRKLTQFLLLKIFLLNYSGTMTLAKSKQKSFYLPTTSREHI